MEDFIQDLFKKQVSIQPKPKTGLEGSFGTIGKPAYNGFNPAEAEDGFRSGWILLAL